MLVDLRDSDRRQVNTMKQVEGIWLPDEDTHFQTMFPQFPKVGGRATYQYDKLQSCLDLCQSRRVAVDVGAHVGLWSMILCDHFATVVAFEPVFAKHFRRNLEEKPNVVWCKNEDKPHQLHELGD
jgi:hypothetical protein